MKRSELFTKTSKTVPSDETAKNAQLLIRAGFIYKEMAGVYAYLPLGLMVIEKIKQIVREEMNSVAGQELIMTSLQRKELWEVTDRWDDEKVDVWFKSELKNGTPVGFGWSHEEQITAMMTNYISSYRDLPIMVYQFQTKLRNELRSKSGIMRGREFVMKDAYTYSRDEAEHTKQYDALTAAYLRIFDRVGLGEVTYFTVASGGAFTQFSHEFQTISDAGEDHIYVDPVKRIAVNEEVLTDEVIKDLGVKREDLVPHKSAEVGNIFSFGSVKSEQLGLYYNDESGAQKPVILGSYGVGITRLMGVLAEHFSDAKGLVWPISVAPFLVYLITVGRSPEVLKEAESIYHRLTTAGVEVLYDDRDIRPGEKFADAELMGIPYRLVISESTLAAKTVELKVRQETESSQISRDLLLQTLGVVA